MLPTPLQLLPLSQRPVAQVTEPLGFTPPPQQEESVVHQVPVSRQPPAGWHTVTPEPGSAQIREQQLLPPLQGLPSWVQPPPPPPEMMTPPHAWPQQSSSRVHTSLLGWQ
jgi:hypothetical protein